jgi:hypothetical protein
MFVGEIAINTPNYKSAVFSEVYRTLTTAINNQKAFSGLFAEFGFVFIDFITYFRF